MAAKEQQVISFHWEGKDKNGNRSQGKIEADSPTAAKALLRNQGINPQKIRKESQALVFLVQCRCPDQTIWTLLSLQGRWQQ